MDEKTQAEYDRIKAGPHSGSFTLLHHEGPVVGQSQDVMERIEYILQNKPADEILPRLQHIWPIPASAYKAYQEAIASTEKAYQEARASTEKAYQEAIAPAEKAYQEAIASAEKAYQEARASAEKAYQEAIAPAEKAILALIPNCKWDGKTIFGS